VQPSKGKSSCCRHLLSRKCVLVQAKDDESDLLLPAVANDSSAAQGQSDPPLPAIATDSSTMQDQSDVPLEPATILDVTPSFLSMPTVEPALNIRDHDNAALYACQQTHCSESDKIKTLYILESMRLSPFALTDTLGNEQNALAHPDIVKKLSPGQLHLSAATPNPKKRKLAADSLCENWSPISAPGIDRHLADDITICWRVADTNFCRTRRVYLKPSE